MQYGAPMTSSGQIMMSGNSQIQQMCSLGAGQVAERPWCAGVRPGRAANTLRPTLQLQDAATRPW